MSGRPPATYEDLRAVPEPLVAEIIGGELITSPRPRARHAVTASFVAARLISSVGGGEEAAEGEWWVLFEPELHLGRLTGRERARDEVLVPDIAAWRRSRLPQVPDTQGIEVPPDWVCEVLSPSTARTDRVRKMAVYAQVGVTHVWLVDPSLRTLEVYRLTSGLLALVAAHEGDAVVTPEPFGVRFDLRRWWPDPGPDVVSEP